MLKHQLQADGKKRESDNWKKGMPKRVYLESLLRHVLDVWGGVTWDDSVVLTPTGLEDALCAVIFNASGLLRAVLLERAEAALREGHIGLTGTR